MTDVPEGTVFKITGGNTGSMTELERLAESGKLAGLQDLPPQLRKQIEAQMKKDEEEAVNKLAGVRSQIADEVDFEGLPSEMRQEKIGVLQDLMNAANGMSDKGDVTTSSVPVDPRPTPEKSSVSSQTQSKGVEEGTKICPNCAWVVSENPSDVTEEDKRQWLRSFVGNTRFTKRYTLFGGGFEIIFRTRTIKEQIIINRQLVIDTENSRLPRQPASLGVVARNMRLRQLNMTASLQYMSGFNAPIPELLSSEFAEQFGTVLSQVEAIEDDTIFHKAHDALFSRLQESVYAAVYKQFVVFDDLVFKLTETASSPDFWKGTVGSS